MRTDKQFRARSDVHDEIVSIYAQKTTVHNHCGRHKRIDFQAIRYDTVSDGSGYFIDKRCRGLSTLFRTPTYIIPKIRAVKPTTLPVRDVRLDCGTLAADCTWYG